MTVKHGYIAGYNEKMMKKKLQSIIYQAIKTAIPEVDIWLKDVRLDYPSQEIFGDYACNIAMVLSRRLKTNPAEIAQRIVDELLKDPQRQEQFKEITVAGGFINFKLADSYLREIVREVAQQGAAYGQSDLGKGAMVHLDFVSANPTGPVHLGNGRGGPFGDALANMLSKAGFRPWREYYVNDYGNQIKVLGHSVLKDDEAQYRGDYIDDLNRRVKDADPFLAGQAAAKIIIHEMILPSMEKLGINFDQYFSEKSLHESGAVEQAFQMLKDKELLYEQDGALWFKATDFGDEKDRVVRKQSGEVTYFGGDIAYHLSKFQRGADQAIDIWGADHHGDVKRVMGAMEALGFGGRLKIMLTQLLKVMKDGQEFKMSKRNGTYISMDDLLDEVGKDAVRFFFLMYSNDTHMVFDLNLAKEKSDKNPVFYVQYAHARICSILKKVQEKLGDLAGSSDPIADESWELHPKEAELIKHLARFPELVEEVALSHEVHKLPYYAIGLADRFHSFYHDCQVLDSREPELSRARLELVKAAKTVLAETLRLVGVDAPERM